MNCYTELTYIYSSHCIEKLKELVESLNSTFSIKDKLDDMFWYGVFCNPETYANYKCYCQCPDDVPDLLMNEDEPLNTRMIFVRGTIDKVTKHEIEKPEWMYFVESYESFNKFEDSPSTFLYLIPKDKKYQKFGEALINFLYSPNLMVTMKNI